VHGKGSSPLVVARQVLQSRVLGFSPGGLPLRRREPADNCALTGSYVEPMSSTTSRSRLDSRRLNDVSSNAMCCQSF
jgi:hypothetical protein